ncbi:MAG: molecular chaperone HtpG, partial [Myxococcota bacterium]
MSEAKRHEFQAEVKQLLHLMIHSLYSHKEIFLRELISNASDALDRLRFEQVTNEALQGSDELHIRLEPDKGTRTLTIHDNGIGMTRAEIVENLGTIARSGTKNFLNNVKDKEGNIPPELIGQFGVGFYASFMVADKVEVLSRKAGEEGATRWISTGDAFEVEDAKRDKPGTSITLHLKEKNEEDHLDDYTDDWVLRRIVKRYSDFVSYPIKLQVWEDKGESGTKTLEDQTLNSRKAIWARPKDEVTDDEYNEFYRHVSHDWSEPMARIPIRIEGTFEAQGLLFIPSQAPMDLFHPEMKRGVQLYVKRVFIMDECKELIPAYLRWVKGVVDAQDLSLNVSREILQKDRQIRAIHKQLVKKVFDTLSTLQKEKPEDYQKFCGHFGAALKEGLISGEAKDHERILDAMLVRTTEHDGLVSLAEVVEKLGDEPEGLWFMSGASVEAIQNSPHLEAFKAKKIPVLLFSDAIDEIWLDRGLKYKDIGFRSVAKGDVDLPKGEDDEKKKEERDQAEKDYKDVLTAVRVRLQEEVQEVRLSQRLTDSAVCLVADANAMNPQMERLMRQMGQDIPKQKRILELNP